MENAVTGVKTEFRGLSKWSYNVAVLYEKGPISGRLAYNWRQHFLDTPNFENSGFDLIADNTAQMDGSLSYKIGDRTHLTLEGVNLLRSPSSRTTSPTSTCIRATPVATTARCSLASAGRCKTRAPGSLEPGASASRRSS